MTKKRRQYLKRAQRMRYKDGSKYEMERAMTLWFYAYKYAVNGDTDALRRASFDVAALPLPKWWRP